MKKQFQTKKLIEIFIQVFNFSAHFLVLVQYTYRNDYGVRDLTIFNLIKF